MKTEIKFYEKNVYGNSTLYIADREMAVKLTQLTGRRTICERDMELISSMFDVTFTQVFAPREAVLV